jgi:quercetin dioxygenase-like cupin family protein
MDLTTARMAGDLGADAALVERYESGQEEIPVGYLLKVAQRYNVDLTVLISGDESHLKNFSVVRKGEGLSVERRKDYDYKSLAYRFAGRRMEPFLITVPPKAVEAMNHTTHAGQEFIYVLSGRLELRLDGHPVTLEPGDSVYFDSKTPHSLRGLDEAAAQFLDVIL